MVTFNADKECDNIRKCREYDNDGTYVCTILSSFHMISDDAVTIGIFHSGIRLTPPGPIFTGGTYADMTQCNLTFGNNSLIGPSTNRRGAKTGHGKVPRKVVREGGDNFVVAGQSNLMSAALGNRSWSFNPLDGNLYGYYQEFGMIMDPSSGLLGYSSYNHQIMDAGMQFDAGPSLPVGESSLIGSKVDPGVQTNFWFIATRGNQGDESRGNPYLYAWPTGQDYNWGIATVGDNSPVPHAHLPEFVNMMGEIDP